MSNKKGGAEVFIFGKSDIELHQEMNTIQRNPADGKNGNHGNQHQVGPFLSLELQLIFFL